MIKRNLLQAFDDEFVKEIRNSRSHQEAFYRASEKFETTHNFQAFESFDSFRKKKERKKRKSR